MSACLIWNREGDCLYTSSLIISLLFCFCGFGIILIWFYDLKGWKNKGAFKTRLCLLNIHVNSATFWEHINHIINLIKIDYLHKSRDGKEKEVSRLERQGAYCECLVLNIRSIVSSCSMLLVFIKFLQGPISRHNNQIIIHQLLYILKIQRYTL